MRVLFALALLGSAFSVPAAAQSFYEVDGDMLVHDATGIGVPAAIGSHKLTEAKEFSHPGTGTDAVFRYASPDGEIFATAYVYLPSLSHPGLASLATDQAIRLASKDKPVGTTGSNAIAVGGIARGGIRTDYSGYQGRLASSAVLIKADRWLVKLRISGPDARRAEVLQAMDTLIGRLRFPARNKPMSTEPIAPPPCPSATSGSAALKPPSASATAADARVAADDAAISGRIGGSWCRTFVSAGESRVQVIRNPSVTPADGQAHSVALALYADNGGTLEVVQTGDGRYMLINHQIGEAALLGSFDGPPSDAQIGAMLAGNGDIGTTRATVRITPERAR